MAPLRITVVGDRNPDFPPHRALDQSIEHVSARRGVEIDLCWAATRDVERRGTAALEDADALWAAPGSPYHSIDGALLAIRYAREYRVPLLATCGGCQHVVIEYARNVLGVRDAQHAEYDPNGSRLFVTPLTCSLKGRTMWVELLKDDRLRALYGASRTAEQYYCDFGINPDVEADLEREGLRIVGRDTNGEARILTIQDHPFFVATLFVPPLTSTPAKPHPLVEALVYAAMQHRGGNPTRSRA